MALLFFSSFKKIHHDRIYLFHAPRKCSKKSKAVASFLLFFTFAWFVSTAMAVAEWIQADNYKGEWERTNERVCWVRSREKKIKPHETVSRCTRRNVYAFQRLNYDQKRDVRRRKRIKLRKKKFFCSLPASLYRPTPIVTLCFCPPDPASCMQRWQQPGVKGKWKGNERSAA